MIFKQSIVGNNQTAADQWKEVLQQRNMCNMNELQFEAIFRANGLQANVGLIPQDVFQEFDNTTVIVMTSDDGDTFLNDLMPLSKSVSIGKLVHKFRQASDAGRAQSSMTGQIGVKMDQVEYKFDGSIIPIHDLGFFRNWREWNAQQSENFDGLIDDQRETMKTLRRKLADNFLDGHTDANGQTIVVDGLSWAGMRNDSRVSQIDLGGGGINFDFTDASKTGEEIKAAFIQVRDIAWITNKCERQLTYYISREIASNFERKFSTQYDAKLIDQELSSLRGVANIKETSKLSGNELMAFPLDEGFVRPIVGMAMNTVAMPRPVYNSNYEFVNWGAIGFEVREDFNGNSCALFAQA